MCYTFCSSTRYLKTDLVLHIYIKQLKNMENSVVHVRQVQSVYIPPACGSLPTCLQH